MAYAGGYAGGYADAVVAPPVSPPVVGGGFAGPVWSPDRPAPLQGLHREGRSTLRLTVSAYAWGHGEQRSRQTIAAVAVTQGEGTTRTRHQIGGFDLLARNGHARGTTRADVLTHAGDPREDDELILTAAALLLSEFDHGSTP